MAREFLGGRSTEETEIEGTGVVTNEQIARLVDRAKTDNEKYPTGRHELSMGMRHTTLVLNKGVLKQIEGDVVKAVFRRIEEGAIKTQVAAPKVHAMDVSLTCVGEDDMDVVRGGDVVGGGIKGGESFTLRPGESVEVYAGQPYFLANSYRKRITIATLTEIPQVRN